MKKRIITCAVVSILAIAIVLIVVVWKIWLTVPTPPPYQQGVGAEYAKNLAERTQRLSFVLLIIGWISVTLGGVLATAGAVLGTKPLTEDNRTAIVVLACQRGLICTVLAVVLGGIGWQFIDRSTSATKTASIATTALATATVEVNGEKDKTAYKACVQAKSAWLEGRMNNDRLQIIVKSLSKSDDAE